jgi:hypothetical protein
MTLAFLAALLALHVALRALPIRPRGGQRRGDDQPLGEQPLCAVDCALLRGGARAAVLTAQAILFVRGAPPVATDPHGVLVAAVGDVAELPGWRTAWRRPVRRALAVLREPLVTQGLLAPTGHLAVAWCSLLGVPVVAVAAVLTQPLSLRTVVGAGGAVGLSVLLCFAPGRTIAGARVLRAQRRRFERETLGGPGAPADVDAIAMLVALQGRPALDLLTQPGPPPGPPPTQPALARPTPIQPTPSEPAPSEPAPSEPTPSQPTPSQPEPVQQAAAPSSTAPGPAIPAPAIPSPAAPSPAASAPDVLPEAAGESPFKPRRMML